MYLLRYRGDLRVALGIRLKYIIGTHFERVMLNSAGLKLSLPFKLCTKGIAGRSVKVFTCLGMIERQTLSINRLVYDSQ